MISTGITKSKLNQLQLFLKFTQVEVQFKVQIMRVLVVGLHRIAYLHKRYLWLSSYRYYPEPVWNINKPGQRTNRTFLEQLKFDFFTHPLKS